jgi:UDP-N-acetylmuramate--alanine ligase
MVLEKENIYFVGIGGIGMSALARYFNNAGKKVAGYDRTITDLTKRLQAEGMSVSYFDDADAIPFPYRDKEKTLIVYTPAIPASNSILKYFQEEGFECKKRAEVLGMLSAGMKTVAVAGTHGKTTISSMIAYVLSTAGKKINALLGGISRDFGSNIVLHQEAEYLVTEADEYDRSFLQLSPSLLVITSIDPDHLDIYKDKEDLKETYRQLIARLNGGLLLTKPQVVADLELSDTKIKTYALNDSKAASTATNIRVEEGNFVFDYQGATTSILAVKCGLPGIHNVENAVAAIGICLELGIEAEQIKEAIGTFHGVKRRFDVHLKQDDVTYIDDYAHHPEEIKMLLSSVRELYPNKKVCLVFQPHLYSRTRDFGEEFAAELDKADDVILLDLYPAREEPIEDITSLWLAKKMKKKDVHVCAKHQLINVLKSKEIEVLLTVGAGDIDTMIDPIINHYDTLA